MSKDINSCSACDENYDLFHEILASDGVKAAGTDTAVTETKPEAIERSAPAAAPVCEWGKEDILGYRSRSCSKHPTPYKPRKFCANCGLPISIKSEAAR
jgi:hypothetical protein